MDLITLAVLIIAVSVAVLVAVLTPMIIQLRNTMASADTAIKNLDASLKPILDDEVKPMINSVHGMFEELHGAATAARQGVEKVDETLDSLQEVGDAVKTIKHVLDSSIKTSVVELAAYVAGVKAGLGTFVNVLKRRGQKEV